MDAFYPPAKTFEEAQAQNNQLKRELAEKQREVDLYLHVAARATAVSYTHLTLPTILLV